MKLKKINGILLMVIGFTAIATFAVMGATGYDATFCLEGIGISMIILGMGATFLISTAPKTTHTDDMNV